MKRRSSWLLIAMVCLLAACVCIAACGSEGDDPQPAASSTSSTVQATSSTEGAESIMVYAGAGLKKPMDEIGMLFDEQRGVAIEYNYTGSGAQLSQMELTEEGDAFMPGAAMYLDTAEEKGFVAYRQNVAYHIPVITVPKGNPANITRLEDLGRPDVELVWGDPEVAAIGKTGIGILEKAGIYEAAWANVVATFPTMNEVMLQISLGQADAAINWWDTVKFDDTIEVIQIPKNQNDIKLIPIGSLTFSKYPETARGFVDFCVSDQGKAVFEKHGFVTYPDAAYEE